MEEGESTILHWDNMVVGKFIGILTIPFLIYAAPCQVGKLRQSCTVLGEASIRILKGAL